MTNWYDFFDLDTKTVSDIQSKIQTIDAMTTSQIKEFMSHATTVVTTNLAKTGLVDFVDPSGEVMKWRINTTTDVEERLLGALDTMISSNLKIKSSRETPGHLRDLITKNVVVFLVDAFVGLPCEQTKTIKSIPSRVSQLANNLHILWNSKEAEVPAKPVIGNEVGVPAKPVIGNDVPANTAMQKMRDYTNLYFADITTQLKQSISDKLKPIFENYIDGATDELSNVNAEYVDDLIYNSFVAYMTQTRDKLTATYTEMGYDAADISKYYDEILPRHIYDMSAPASGVFSVATRIHTGELEVVRLYGVGNLLLREKTVEYKYDNSAWCNRISRTMAQLRFMISQGNENAMALLAFAANAFVAIPEVFVSRGFVFTNIKAGSLDEFALQYKPFVATSDANNNTSIIQYSGEIPIGVITVPAEPYTSASEAVLRFQYDIFKNTNGYIYLYDRTTIPSTITGYWEGLSEIDKTITASNIFQFGLEDGSPIANAIVGVSRAVDKTALTIASVAKMGVQIISPVGVPVIYLAEFAQIILRELWWKLGWDDLSTTFNVPPPFGVVLSLLHPIYSLGATAKYPALVSLEKLYIMGIRISQFISKCIRDGLFVRLLNDSNVRFLGVNFLMTPVYSSTGIIEGTQMKRILDDKSYARLLALQILLLRYQECDKTIDEWVINANTKTSNFQLNPTARDEIVKKVSVSFLKTIHNNLFVQKTENYSTNFMKLSSSIQIPINTIDFQFYETQSLASLSKHTNEVMRDYGIDTTISDGDIQTAITSIRTQYEQTDTFQNHIYMADTQATTQNGYFLRGVDMTDNGMLTHLKSEIDGCIVGSSLMNTIF
jgi:hypothetical protein